MTQLEALYAQALATPSDIDEHLPVLRFLASCSPRVVELGVRGGTSTVALLAGLAGHRGKYTGYDLAGPPEHLAGLAREAGVEYLHKIQSTLDQNPAFAPECELLFIDTLHQADQVFAELQIFAPRCRRWIAFHDTATFGEHGEGGGLGLLHGMRRYLAQDPGWHWREAARFPNNNGLTVWERA